MQMRGETLPQEVTFSKSIPLQLPGRAAFYNF